MYFQIVILELTGIIVARHVARIVWIVTLLTGRVLIAVMVIRVRSVTRVRLFKKMCQIFLHTFNRASTSF